MSVVSVYAIFADAVEAERIGRTVVEERLAACINIFGSCHSVYRWQGTVETANEVPAILKSTAALADALIERIAELHSYDVPCITMSPVLKLLESYANWVEQNVGAVYR